MRHSHNHGHEGHHLHGLVHHMARHFGRHRGEAWGEEHGHPGRGRRRVFDSAELRLVLLKLLKDQPRHGYDLIRAVEELTAGAYSPSPGVVYPTLTLLSDMGHIAEETSGVGDRARSAMDDIESVVEETHQPPAFLDSKSLTTPREGS